MREETIGIITHVFPTTPRGMYYIGPEQNQYTIMVVMSNYYRMTTLADYPNYPIFL